MNREYHCWWSQRTEREMPLLVFGHAGAKVLVFPTRDGRFHEYEDLQIVAAVAHKIEAGHLQLYCVDGADAFYRNGCGPEERLRRAIAHEEYVLNEVLPLMAAKNQHPCTIVHGLSLGAYHAANLAFRHPHLFQKLCAFSGRYDLTHNVENFRDLLDGYRGEQVYYHTPVRYVPGLDGWQLQSLRRMDVVLVIGREDPFVDNNRHFGGILAAKCVPHALHEWEGRAHSAQYWRRMAPAYL
jgi:esterase/lipase superfamily enzyme